MTIQLQVTRPKIFINSSTVDGEKKIRLNPGRHTKVPDWVRDSLGFEMGLKDKSIVDLTPPPLPKPSHLSVAELRVALAEAEAREAESAGEETPKQEKLEVKEVKDDDQLDDDDQKSPKAKPLPSNITPKVPAGLQGGKAK
jgi:hypothetical protein